MTAGHMTSAIKLRDAMWTFVVRKGIEGRKGNSRAEAEDAFAE